MLNQASLFGEFDDVKGVTENILLGQVRASPACLHACMHACLPTNSPLCVPWSGACLACLPACLPTATSSVCVVGAWDLG